ncbi:MAG: adenylate/guanylate cyclase domain-containing protein [Pseudomonadota bacterium]
MKTGRVGFLAGQPGIVTPAVIFSAAWCSLAILLISVFPYTTANLSSRVYDWKLSIGHVRSYSPEIVHLDIDDQAVKEYGQWPWDRRLSGKIVDKLTEFGAKVLIFDIYYASPGKDQTGNTAFFEAVKKAGTVISATGITELTDSNVPKLRVDEDRARADALYDVSWPLTVPAGFGPLRAVSLESTILPLLPLIKSSRAVGHIAATPDPDGVYRQVALLVRLENRCIPSLSLAALSAYWNLRPDSVTLFGGKEIRIARGTDTLRIPVDSRGMMLVNWGEAWTSFKHYSAKDVLSEAPDPSRPARYKDKLVIIAVTATGNADVCTTPLSTNVPLNRIHSHAINTVLTGSFITRVPVFPWIAILAAGLAVAFPWATAKSGLRWLSFAAISVCLSCLFAEVFLFVAWGYDAPLSMGLLIFLPAACGFIVIKGISAERQAAQARRALERYLPPELLEKSIGGGAGPDLSDRRLESTIVFVDMQGFSTISETVETEYISRFLREFFEVMSRVIVENRGRIHQFLGDGFLAVFGDLIPIADHADAAVKAALEMQQEMNRLSAKWENSGIREFEQGLRIRIGINTGVVFVGDLGSDRRLEYTVVGSAVNIAARLQVLAPPGGILTTSRTKALLKDPSRCIGPESVKLKGIDREVKIYTVSAAGVEDAIGGEPTNNRPS